MRRERLSPSAYLLNAEAWKAAAIALRFPVRFQCSALSAPPPGRWPSWPGGKFAIRGD